jgi:hypothetical protein
MVLENGGREVPYTLGRPAGGGDTTDKGMTWAGFSRTNRSVVKVVVVHEDGRASTAEINRQPNIRVPANPTD